MFYNIMLVKEQIQENLILLKNLIYILFNDVKTIHKNMIILINEKVMEINTENE